jgi:hypothetical protein
LWPLTSRWGSRRPRPTPCCANWVAHGSARARRPCGTRGVGRTTPPPGNIRCRPGVYRPGRLPGLSTWASAVPCSARLARRGTPRSAFRVQTSARPVRRWQRSRRVRRHRHPACGWLAPLRASGPHRRRPLPRWPGASALGPFRVPRCVFALRQAGPGFAEGRGGRLQRREDRSRPVLTQGLRGGRGLGEMGEVSLLSA